MYQVALVVVFLLTVRTEMADEELRAVSTVQSVLDGKGV